MLALQGYNLIQIFGGGGGMGSTVRASMCRISSLSRKFPPKPSQKLVNGENLLGRSNRICCNDCLTFFCLWFSCSNLLVFDFPMLCNFFIQAYRNDIFRTFLPIKRIVIASIAQNCDKSDNELPWCFSEWCVLHFVLFLVHPHFH